MNCRRAGTMIPFYAGGELSEKKSRRLEGHLERCSECQAKAEEFQIILAKIQTAARGDELDWVETEWKRLMTLIKTQPPPRRARLLGMSPKPAWAYGAAAFLLLALSVIILRPRFFTPTPIQPTEILASTEVQPGRSPEFADSRFSRLPEDFPFRVREERPPVTEPEMLIADSAGSKESQNILSMTLVSQESGLKVHWTFNRNFEWKEEAKR